MVRAHVFVSGKVQGVFYRDSTKKEADKWGAHGWVRNLKDGRVEAVFEGPPPIVEALVTWCHQGSPLAQVSHVERTSEAEEGLAGFAIQPTA